MNLPRLHALAKFLYGADATRQVFEPMLADCAAEFGASSSLRTRLRWYLAMVVALMQFAPRGLSRHVTFAQMFDIGARTTTIAAFAFGMQWLFGSWSSVARAPQAWPPSVATTLPFIIVPLVAGIRRLPLPRPQRRLMAIAVSLATSVALAVAISGSWIVSGAAMMAAHLIAHIGWRTVDPVHFEDRQKWKVFIRPMMIGSIFAVATWPLKLAMGEPFFQPFWPGGLVILYIIGAAIHIISASKPDASPAEPR